MSVLVVAFLAFVAVVVLVIVLLVVLLGLRPTRGPGKRRDGPSNGPFGSGW